LFAEWQEHYAAKVVLDRRDAVENIMRLAEAHAQENPAPSPFRCPCGAETKSAHDPDFFAIHGPHIAAAKAVKQ